jgi:hypothetical protein
MRYKIGSGDDSPRALSADLNGTFTPEEILDLALDWDLPIGSRTLGDLHKLGVGPISQCKLEAGGGKRAKRCAANTVMIVAICLEAKASGMTWPDAKLEAATQRGKDLVAHDIDKYLRRFRDARAGVRPLTGKTESPATDDRGALRRVASPRPRYATCQTC